LSEWIANFIKDDGYPDEDIYADELYDDDYVEGDFDDDGVVESILIIGIMMTLVFLLWWRQRIQRVAEDARRREQGLPPQPQPQMLNAENDFRAWAAGGLGM
jgi:SEL1 protein